MGARRHVMAPQLQAKVPIHRGRAASEEINPWFWNPGLYGVKREPDWFRKQLDEIDKDLAATWNPVAERWQVWFKKESVNTPLCRGWFYLFPVQHADGSYCPLDERTLAKIYSISRQCNGSGKAYFERVVNEMAREKAAAEKRIKNDTLDGAGEYFDYTLPKVGYGPISSSKVVGQ